MNQDKPKFEQEREVPEIQYLPTKDEIISMVEEVKEEPKEEKPKFSHVQLHDALLYTHDMLDRASINFMVLGDVAKSILSTDLPTLDTDKIHVGVLKKHYTESGSSMLLSLLKKYEFVGNSILTKYKGVPIQIDIIQSDYEFFKNPDTRGYTTEEFKIPNPFIAYWNLKEVVK